jgi:GNAT superfamily N-acetyltransferase
VLVGVVPAPFDGNRDGNLPEWPERIGDSQVGMIRLRLVRCSPVTITVHADEPQGVRIEAAADHLDVIPAVAGWHWVEWGYVDPQGSVESWAAALMEKTNRDRVPTTGIAMLGDLPVGSISLVEHDMPDRPDLAVMTPWLAGLYVVPTHRRCGIATHLVRLCESEALCMGIAKVYLYSSTARYLYQRLGWERLADDFYEGEAITIMSKVLRRTEDR